MKRIAPTFMGASLTLFLLAVIFNFSQNAAAAPAANVVISEIQIAGATSSDDFIELYNPTSSDINLGDMRLIKRSSSGTVDTDIVVFSASDIIKAHGYYLWCNTALAATLTCDKSSADTISNNNSIGLRNEPVNTGALVDSVTFGAPNNPLGEGSPLTAPEANTSVERKANSSSDLTSMNSGGIDEFGGNAEDTNNNASDFILRSASQPQNSLSSLEPINVPSISSSITPTNSPSPTQIPSTSPSPTPSLTPSPTQIISPTPSLSPTNSPTPLTSTPTLTPAPTIMPSISPIPPTPTPKIILQTPKVSCSIMFRSVKILSKTIYIPIVKCIHL